MNKSQDALGVLIVGTGYLGAQRAAAARVAEGTRLAGVYDPDQRAAEAVASRAGVPWFASYEEALAHTGADAVVIASPHVFHAQQVHEALDAGKAVLCEKPLAIEADDALALVELADERGLTLATGFNHRLYPPVEEALRLVQSGAIGEVASLRVQIGHRASAGFLKSWHGDPALCGGGTLMDNGPHACDLIRVFLGEVSAVQGATRTDRTGHPGSELEAEAIVRAAHGGVAELRSSWVLEEGYLTLEIRGEKGHLKVGTAPWRLTGQLATGQRVRRGYLAERIKERLHQKRHGCERSHVRELEAFALAVRTSTTTACGSGCDGYRAAEMIAAIYRSAELGSQQRIPARLASQLAPQASAEAVA